MAEAFLRPDRVRDLGLDIELDAPRLLVVAGDRLAELGNAARHRITVVRRFRRRFSQLLDRDVG
jgi:hypothetical protein